MLAEMTELGSREGIPYSKECIRFLQAHPMTTAIAKITSKSQTTIPQEIRTALHLSPGDTIVWELIEGGAARVRRVEPLDLDYLRALEGTLGEWNSSADEEAYRDL